jgi:anaerobic magnesium-protoporphyrin IX monomethyl ester cyclase
MILINSSPKNALKIFQPFLPITTPVGPGYLYEIMKQNGHPIDFIDEQIEGNIVIEKKIDQYVRKSPTPYIFGFSVLTAAFESALQLSKLIKKKYPDSVIIFGGIHPTAVPEEVLAFSEVDVVVRGEGEYVLPDLYRNLKNRSGIESIPGISFRKNGEIIHNPISGIITDLDSLPRFPYYLFPEDKGYDLGFIATSRGCPYNCIFCSNRVTTSKGYRYRSAENSVIDLELLYHQFGKKFIGFYDDNFLVNKKRTRLLIEEIKRKNLHKLINFGFQARGDNVDEDILRELYDAGARTVFYGIETSSNRLLEVIKKGETMEQIISAVRISKKIGYHVSATFIYGLPTESHLDRMNCVKLSKALDLDMVRFNNATPYPGTELYSIAKKENRLNIQGLYNNFISVSTFIENPFNKIPFSYVPEGNEENEIRKDLLFSYLAFYLRFKELKSLFSNPEKSGGWFNAGEKVVSFIKKVPALVVLFFFLSMKFCELLISILFQRNTSISRSEFCELLKYSYSGNSVKTDEMFRNSAENS